MGKIIMAYPKVIAVTFDQSNSMKNKYNEYINSIASEKTTNVTDVKPIQEEQVLFDSPENNEVVNSNNQNNLFSSQNDDKAVDASTSSPHEIADNSLSNVVDASMKKAIGDVVLSDNDLKELEDGLMEVIKIAELSIHSVIEQYRQKGKKIDANISDGAIVAENNSSALNSSNIFEPSSSNIFDVPSDSKRIA